MLELMGITLAGILMVLGLLGCILPSLPGPPLSYVGLVILALFRHFAPPLSPTPVIALGLVTLGAALLDQLIPFLGAKHFGTSHWGLWGSVAGMVIGFVFFSPFGLFVGALLGAVAAEYLARRWMALALKAGWGVLLGIFAGTAIKLGTSGLLTSYFVRALF